MKQTRKKSGYLTFRYRCVIRGAFAYLSFFVLIALLNNTQILAQEKTSTTPRNYVTLPVEGDFEARIADMLKQVKKEQDFQKYISDLAEQLKQAKKLNINKDDLKEFNFDDPLIKKRIEKMLQDPAIKDLKLDQQKRKQIEDMLKKMEVDSKPKENDPVPPIKMPMDNNPPIEPPQPQDSGNVQPGDSSTSAPQDPLNRWIDGVIDPDAKSRIGKMLLESESVQNALVDITQYWQGDQANFLGMARADMNQWFDQMPKFDWERSWLNKSGIRLGRWRLPPVPGVRMRMPNVGVPSAAFGGPAVSSSFEIIIFIAAVVLGCGLILAFMLKSGGSVDDEQQQKVWRLGRWPLNPATVSTRGELVQAFDYLALLLFGQPAMHWNHRTIADQVASNPSGRWTPYQDAMANLAQMYEQARYAPADEPISQDDLHRCRQYLTSLAGAANA